MPILKEITNQNGLTLSYHLAIGIKSDLLTNPDVTVITVRSWASEQSYADGDSTASEVSHEIPSLGVSPKNAEQSLIDAPGSEFIGGSLLHAPGGLEVARGRQWSKIKQIRNQLEQSGFTWDGSTFDSNMISSIRWTATLGKASREHLRGNAEWTETWKLADNTYRVLTATDVIAVDDARYAYVKGLHTTCAILEAQVNDPAKTTIAEVEAVSWPLQR